MLTPHYWIREILGELRLRKTAMRVLYTDEHSMRQGGPICLVFLNKVCYVVARGYLCQVADAEEGRLVIKELQNPGQGEGALR